ncbi:hypothetical protein ACFQDM_00400 [Ponticaulis profundi]|uniref:DUF1190 domain-containing protein n=2 Tax=Ponticaulis profundi TaxID=2665222 RepID=A0ABW1S4R9_9PROT
MLANLGEGEMNDSADKPRKSLRQRPMLLGLLVFIGISVGSHYLTRLTMPHRHAQVFECRGAPADGAFFNNACDEDINFRYCLISKEGREQDVCRSKRLKPGEGVTTYLDDKRAMGEAFSTVVTWACKPPFQPDLVSTPSSSVRKRHGCRRPREGES